MSETIKVALEADATQLTNEFRKAQAASSAYSRQIEQDGGRTLRARLAEIAALREEAAGNKAAALAIREKNAMIAEARKLAERSGLSEQASLVLLEKKAALERKIASDQLEANERLKQEAVQRAEIEKKAVADQIAANDRLAASKRAAQQGAVLSRETGEVAALQQEVAGNQAAAAAIREKISLGEQARRLAERSGLSEQAALQLLQKRVLLERQAAEVRNRQVVLPIVQAELNRAAFESERLNRSIRGGQRGFRSNADNMIIFAQAADDAQYGMRGLSNQIPQLAMALGLSGGLAGGIAIAAVAITQILPLMKKLFADGEVEKINAVTEAIAKRYETELEQLRKLDQEKDIRAEVERLTRDIASYAERELRIQDQRLDILDQQAAAMKLQRGLQDEIARERAAIAEAGITGGGATAEQARQDIILAAAEQARAAQARRMEEDIARARQDARLSGEEYNRIRQEAENIRASYTARIQSAEEEIARLRRNVATSRSRVEGFEVGVQNGAAGATTNLRRSRARLAQDEEALALQVKLLEEERKLAAEADTAAKAQLSALSARIDAAEREKRTIEQTAEARKELDDLKAQRERLQAQQSITAARKQEADEAARAAQQAEREGKAREKEAERAAREQAQRTASRGDFAAELRVLELRARGQSAAAEALEQEVRLRRESRQIAEQLGITEKQALELARRRAQLLEAQERPDRPTSRIGGDRPGSGLRLGGLRFNRLETSRGLRTSALDREAAARATPENTLASKAASYYERSLANEEALIKIFNKLGVY